MAFATALTRRLGMAHPIIQAPMAGFTPPRLVAAVSEAGGLGSLGAAMLGPDQIREAIRAVRALTRKPFAVNLFVPPPYPPPAQRPALAEFPQLIALRQELGLPAEPDPLRAFPVYADQLAVVLEERPPVFSFHFGLPAPAELEAARRAGSVLVGCATTVAEGQALERAGVDVVVAQGIEAGGHRGTFLGSVENAQAGTLTLTPQLVDSVAVPVAAAGGIMDGRGLAAALALGAGGVAMGTAFLCCPEAGTPDVHRLALRQAGADRTALTKGVTGRHARALRNRLTTAVETLQPRALPFPYQLWLTGEIVMAATQRGQPELMALWSGQGAAQCRTLPAGELVATVMREAAEAGRRISSG